MIHPEIKNIYFLGQTWEGCVKNRPLGYLAVHEEIPTINLLTNTDCVLFDDHSLQPVDLSNDPDWKLVRDKIYVYQPSDKYLNHDKQT